VSIFEDLGGWPALITQLLEKRDLSSEQAHAAISTILAGEATSAQLIGFVVALRAKGEVAQELSGLLDGVLEAATLVPLSDSLRDQAVDIVGTGGDRSHSINISTMAALVVAGSGVAVCKHGARAASSQCGTADVLEALGVAVELSAEGVLRCVEEAGIGFCLAAKFHPAFRFAAPSRREIGIPTVFNLLGPMANPGRVRRQVIGVANPADAARIVTSLQLHGTIKAWVVHGNGLDELTTEGPSTVLALDNGEVRSLTVDPRALGLAAATAAQFVGGDPQHNAAVVHQVLGGQPGPHRDIVLLNAAAGLVVADRVGSLEDGLVVAAESIDSGSAARTLARMIEVSQSVRSE
jgi:anthranilate phosphoribosyltransferase